MSEMDVNQLRELIRLIAPLRALKTEIEQSLVMETYEGTGALVVRNYTGIHNAVNNTLDDAYVASLAIIEDAHDERQQVSQVNIAAAQLLAYITSLTGIPESGHNKTEIQTAPYIIINANNAGKDTSEAIMSMVNDATDNNSG